MSEQAKVIRTLTGKVVSNKMDKSVTVIVERLVRHAVYGKIQRRRTKLVAHDERNECREGDIVTISQCRPISKRKSWQLVEILERRPEA